MPDMPRLVIADEHEIVREGISERLTKAECAEVVGQASDGYTTIKVCRNLQPDLLLMDLSLTRPSGTETFLKLRSILPDLKILVCSSEANTPQAFSTLSLGAVSFIPKQAKGSDFVNAVKSAALGYSCIPVNYLNEFVGLRKNATRTGNIYGLSPRELEIVEACATGAKTKEVAEKLNISVRTVETHRNSIYKKTSCHNMDELMEIAGQI